MLNSCVVNLKVGSLSSHSCDSSGALWTSQHQASHTPVLSLVCSILSLQHEICVLQATTELCRNLATRLRVGQLCSTTLLSPLSGWPWWSTDEATMRYTLAANFASGVGPCMGIVEPFKHLLRVTAHPHFLAVELRAPMGACLGQYGTCMEYKIVILPRWCIVKNTLQELSSFQHLEGQSWTCSLRVQVSKFQHRAVAVYLCRKTEYQSCQSHL